MRKAWLIYNPYAGRFPAGLFLSRAVRVLSDAAWDVYVTESTDTENVAGLAQKAVEAGCQAVFVAGGDGSVGQAAGALAGTDTALGVLPTGTANVWAQGIGLPRLDWSNWFALEEAAASLALGETRLVDVGQCGEHAFLLWGGLGLDGRIVNSLEPRQRWEKALGTIHYATLAFWTSLDWEGLDLCVEAEGRTWEGRFLVAVASNIRSYAGGLLELSPGALVDDGLLDFWLISGRSVVDAVMRVVQVLLGTHVDAPGVVHFQANKATFHSDYPLPMQFDGEPCVLRAPVEFTVCQKALKVLVPREVPPLFSGELSAGGAGV
jgi:YegS/Rv2252/BmrU family lipid kinase